MTIRPTLRAVQSFFAPRAASWEDRFAADQEQFDRVMPHLGLSPGVAVLDAGCGTARAVPGLRRAVGSGSIVVGVDATPEMIEQALAFRRAELAHLLVADVHALPFEDSSFDLVFAGGLLPHLDDPVTALAELARVARQEGRLVIFHVLGRLALAARHGGVPSDDDVLAPSQLRSILASAGWELQSVEDDDWYLAHARRAPH